MGCLIVAESRAACGWAVGEAMDLRSRSVNAQVYLILDEFILGGEIQESSKRVSVTSGVCYADEANVTQQ